MPPCLAEAQHWFKGWFWIFAYKCPHYNLPVKKVTKGSLLMWTLTDGSADCSELQPSQYPGADGKCCHKHVHTACIAEGPGCFERPSAEICRLQYRLSFGGFLMSLCIPVSSFLPRNVCYFPHPIYSSQVSIKIWKSWV